MKKISLIGIILLAGYAAYQLYCRLSGKDEKKPQPSSHHLTDAFSRAKDLALHN